MRIRIYHLAFIFLGVAINASAQQRATGETRDTTAHIEIPGVKLRYVVEGKGKPCLVLGSHLFTPRTFSGKIREHLQLYFVDMRWFAKEYDYIDLEEVTLASLVDDVEAIRAHLNLDKVVLMGHATNGSIAFEYVKRYPDRVSHLIMIGTSPELGTPALDELIAQNWKTAAKERVALYNDKWKKYIDADGLSAEQTHVAIFDAMSPVYWYNPAYDATWLWKDMNIHTSMLAHVTNKVLADYKMFRNGRWIPVPTFVALGSFNYMTPVTVWKDYETISGLTLSIFQKSGLMPQLEESEVFNDRVLKWISEN